MAFTFELSAEFTQLLCEQAARRGVTPEQMALELILNGLGLGEQTTAPAAEPVPVKGLTELFDDWAADEVANGPADPVQAQREWETFRDAMNAHSTRADPIYP